MTITSSEPWLIFLIPFSKVDVIFRARSEVLQNQLAYCYRLLGALKSSHNSTGNYGFPSEFLGLVKTFNNYKQAFTKFIFVNIG